MAGNDTVGEDGRVRDEQRIFFLKDFLPGLSRAIEEGTPVLGCRHRSVMDNMEWCEGCGPRFGLIHVDYRTRKRTIRDSAFFYKEAIETGGRNLD